MSTTSTRKVKLHDKTNKYKEIIRYKVLVPLPVEKVNLSGKETEEKEIINYGVVEIEKDRKCLFRSLSFGKYETQDRHEELRHKIVSHVIKYWETYIEQLNQNNFSMMMTQGAREEDNLKY